MCITFIKLFEHLNNQLNNLTSDHLDYYYKNILELQSNSAKPDSVHIVFDPSTIDQVILKRGEQLQAEVDSNLLFYAINDDLIVTKAYFI